MHNLSLLVCEVLIRTGNVHLQQYCDRNCFVSSSMAPTLCKTAFNCISVYYGNRNKANGNNNQMCTTKPYFRSIVFVQLHYANNKKNSMKRSARIIKLHTKIKLISFSSLISNERSICRVICASCCDVEGTKAWAWDYRAEGAPRSRRCWGIRQRWRA